VEEVTEDGFAIGRNSQNRKVQCHSPQTAPGDIMHVKVTQARPSLLQGEAIVFQ
jgi:tRNA A37 methylthiotransferase MiaB